MNEQERRLLRELTEQLGRALRGDFTVLSLSGSGGTEVESLAESVSKLVNELKDAQEFIAALSLGRLDVDPPPRNHLIAAFKQLHSSLRHLTWQTQQIAAGDLNQRVDFLGEFSVAFNSLIAALQEKRLAEERLRYVSNHDPLTDLYNRGYFTEELERVERGRRFPVSIMVADLDGLKRVNDTLGHAIGDRLIQQAAQVIRSAVRGDDLVARIGGDEFAVILPGTDTPTALEVRDRIRRGEALCNLECRNYLISISVGIATAEQGSSLTEALRLADERMYEDKSVRKQAGGPGRQEDE
ncbi:MAG: GGDEF domain-containing protein [Deltaproteobacteria bacterium]|nr:GGDEF domain-containing protein [Deltaproteobacteria bacterium]TLN04428.1 MAG: GGDEF domain-containing protein [bacterium]